MTISSTRAKQLIRNGCVAHLATVVDRSSETSRVEDILIVWEFPDLFPAELPRIPPDREMIELVVDRILGTTPISKAPYRMAPTELKELTAQFKDLL